MEENMFSMFQQPSVNTDIGTFNYGTERKKVDRRRQTIEALQKKLMTPEQGQIRQYGDYVGYYGGPTLASTALRVLGGALGNKEMGDVDSMDNTLDETSRKALAYQLSQDPSALAKVENDRDFEAAKLKQERGEINKLFSQPSSSGTAEVINPEQAQTSPVRPQTNLQPQELGALASALGGQRPAAPQPPVQAPQQMAPQGGPPPAIPNPMPGAGSPPMPQPQVAPPQVQRPPMQQPSMGDRLNHMDRVSQTGPMGERIANAQLQQMTRPPAALDVKTVKDEDGNERLVAVNPRTGQAEVVYQGANGGGSGRKEADFKLRQGEAFGKARTQVSEAQDAVAVAQQSLRNVNDAVGLAQEVGTRGLLSRTWNDVKSLVKENPAATALEFIASDSLLDASAKLKGVISDKDMDIIRGTRPDSRSTVQEWIRYAERVTPILQRAQERSNQMLDGTRSTAQGMGVPEFQPQGQGQGQGQSQQQSPVNTGAKTKLDWGR